MLDSEGGKGELYHFLKVASNEISNKGKCFIFVIFIFYLFILGLAGCNKEVTFYGSRVLCCVCVCVCANACVGVFVAKSMLETKGHELLVFA